jgi:hypothetical protein
MNSSEELYKRMIEKLVDLVNARNIAELRNWVWIVVGILQSKSVNLSKIAIQAMIFVSAIAHAENLGKKSFRHGRGRF